MILFNFMFFSVTYKKSILNWTVPLKFICVVKEVYLNHENKSI